MTAMAEKQNPIIDGLADGFSVSRLVVPERDVARHLGMPNEVGLDVQLRRGVNRAASWFRDSARPWCRASVHEIAQVAEETVTLKDGIVLHSDVLARGFREAGVEQLVAIALTAGTEIDEEIDRHFADGHPDEAMALNAFAIAAVEHVRAESCRFVTERAADRNLYATPYYSPGYEGWPLDDQQSLFSAIARNRETPIRVLDSGGLEPAKSTLFAVGLTPKPLARSFEFWQHHAARLTTRTHPDYAFGHRVLKKWARNRLSLRQGEDGVLTASFHTSGSTCANMGLPLAFDYETKLKRDNAGTFRFESFSCRPAEGDSNHRSTCQFLSNPDAFAAGISESPPLIGQSLEAALHWNPDVSPAGCLCLRSSRDHKWRIVVQTIHFALANSQFH